MENCFGYRPEQNDHRFPEEPLLGLTGASVETVEKCENFKIVENVVADFERGPKIRFNSKRHFVTADD